VPIPGCTFSVPRVAIVTLQTDQSQSWRITENWRFIKLCHKRNDITCSTLPKYCTLCALYTPSSSRRNIGPNACPARNTT
jgi:hypothetical protein